MATAALAVDPWLEPAVSHSATVNPRHHHNADEYWEKQPRFIDLEWLTEGNNTLYLTASQPEFERLSPVLGGLLADLKDTLHAWDIAGRKLDKPLMIVIDEAGQLELGWLPAEVSTIAALGAFFVTAWQSLSQIEHRYQSQADAVLSGHRTKCFFAGIDDLSTVNFLKGLLGSEHIRRRSDTMDVPSLFGDARSRRSMSESDSLVEFAPANALRQMKPGEAVLLHGTLPPVHLEAVRWWNEKRLRALVPVDKKGNPALPRDLVTCPLSDQAVDNNSSEIDRATVRSALNALAKRPSPVPLDMSGGGRNKSGRMTDQQTLSRDEIEFARETALAEKGMEKRSDGTIRPINARCDDCGQQLGRKIGRQVVRRGRSVALCAPVSNR